MTPTISRFGTVDRTARMVSAMMHVDDIAIDWSAVECL
jgi:hypothetical protein